MILITCFEISHSRMEGWWDSEPWRNSPTDNRSDGFIISCVNARQTSVTISDSYNLCKHEVKCVFRRAVDSRRIQCYLTDRTVVFTHKMEKSHLADQIGHVF